MATHARLLEIERDDSEDGARFEDKLANKGKITSQEIGGTSIRHTVGEHVTPESIAFFDSSTVPKTQTHALLVFFPKAPTTRMRSNSTSSHESAVYLGAYTEDQVKGAVERWHRSFPYFPIMTVETGKFMPLPPPCLYDKNHSVEQARALVLDIAGVFCDELTAHSQMMDIRLEQCRRFKVGEDDPATVGMTPEEGSELLDYLRVMNARKRSTDDEHRETLTDKVIYKNVKPMQVNESTGDEEVEDRVECNMAVFNPEHTPTDQEVGLAIYISKEPMFSKDATLVKPGDHAVAFLGAFSPDAAATEAGIWQRRHPYFTIFTFDMGKPIQFPPPSYCNLSDPKMYTQEQMSDFMVRTTDERRDIQQTRSLFLEGYGTEDTYNAREKREPVLKAFPVDTEDEKELGSESPRSSDSPTPAIPEHHDEERPSGAAADGWQSEFDKSDSDAIGAMLHKWRINNTKKKDLSDPSGLVGPDVHEARAPNETRTTSAVPVAGSSDSDGNDLERSDGLTGSRDRRPEPAHVSAAHAGPDAPSVTPTIIASLSTTEACNGLLRTLTSSYTEAVRTKDADKMAYIKDCIVHLRERRKVLCPPKRPFRAPAHEAFMNTGNKSLFSDFETHPHLMRIPKEVAEQMGMNEKNLKRMRMKDGSLTEMADDEEIGGISFSAPRVREE